MQSEGPYHIRKGPFDSYERIEGPTVVFSRLEKIERAVDALNAAHAEGRKAERERCAHIAEHEAGEIPECMTGRIIAEKIRGRQDAE